MRGSSVIIGGSIIISLMGVESIVSLLCSIFFSCLKDVEGLSCRGTIPSPSSERFIVCTWSEAIYYSPGIFEFNTQRVFVILRLVFFVAFLASSSFCWRCLGLYIFL